MGCIESVVCQFVDLLASESDLLEYQTMRAELSKKQILGEWNPAFTDD